MNDYSSSKLSRNCRSYILPGNPDVEWQFNGQLQTPSGVNGNSIRLKALLSACVDKSWQPEIWFVFLQEQSTDVRIGKTVPKVTPTRLWRRKSDYFCIVMDYWMDSVIHIIRVVLCLLTEEYLHVTGPYQWAQGLMRQSRVWHLQAIQAIY